VPVAGTASAGPQFGLAAPRQGYGATMAGQLVFLLVSGIRKMNTWAI